MSEEETRAARVERFAEIWWKSRADARKSQEFMAMSLGVSKKTIQNWEKGISSPSLFQGSEWFRTLGLNSMRYYMAYLYPETFANLTPNSSEEEVEKALFHLVKQASPKEKREMLYLMTSHHGSSWYALLQMFTAHCHTSFRSRVAAATIIVENYEMEEKTGDLVCPKNIVPDMKVLKQAIVEGKKAVENNCQGYTTPQAYTKA